MNRTGYHPVAATAEWATPWALFRELDREFGFTLDVCATPENAKCPRFFTIDEDGLALQWEGVCWMNPPYGRSLARWVGRAAEMAAAGSATVVALLPARTDTRWWHSHVWDASTNHPRTGVEVRLLPGRIYFEGPAGDRAPFASALVVFRRAA